MCQMSTESQVSLEELDPKLKAILRLKLREMMHLHPVFRDIPSIDPEAYKSRRIATFKGYLMVEPSLVCPNKQTTMGYRRRPVRAQVLTGIAM